MMLLCALGFLSIMCDRIQQISVRKSSNSELFGALGFVWMWSIIQQLIELFPCKCTNFVSVKQKKNCTKANIVSRVKDYRWRQTAFKIFFSLLIHFIFTIHSSSSLLFLFFETSCFNQWKSLANFDAIFVLDRVAFLLQNSPSDRWMNDFADLDLNTRNFLFIILFFFSSCFSLYLSIFLYYLFSLSFAFLPCLYRRQHVTMINFKTIWTKRKWID